MEEVWKDIEGYEGLYKISNLCRIKAIGHNAFKYHNIEYVMKQTINGGYYNIALRKNAKRKTYRVHRLFAKAFIPNPLNKPCINHIDGNRLNNDINNLEWCSYSENTQHAFRIGLTSINKKVILIKNNIEIKSFNSLTSIGNYIGVSRQYIGHCIKNNKKCKGYNFVLKKEV